MAAHALSLCRNSLEMSASTILQFGTSLLRPHKNPLSPLIFPKSVPSDSLRFRRCFSAESAVRLVSGEVDETSHSPAHHPWPEWVTFVDTLKTKGYFVKPPKEKDSDSGGDDTTEHFYRDMNLVKDACLSFARDRYDVFRSLPSEDMQVVVERGCPNLFRKVVNSAKRLRAHLLLDEGDVCSACNLRGSCDRAYVILKDFEAVARTVDLVRILLFYALDPLVLSGGEKPPGRELVDASARKLLTELVNLSEASPDPAPPKPAEKVAAWKERVSDFENKDSSQNVELKTGDWICTKCNYVNFSRNVQCRECNEKPSERVGSADIEIKEGDWTCSKCNFINFARNVRCLKCKVEGPKRVGLDVEKKKGDWDCPRCGFMNFSSKRKCLRCSEPRSQRQLEPGEWECPSCDFVNFRRNMTCKKCNHDRPERASSPVYEEHMWRSPLKEVINR